MDKKIHIFLENLADRFKKGNINKRDFLEKIEEAYFEDLGFAKVDHHRNLRRDFPEVIFGQNKTKTQILEIARSILKYSKILLITRTDRKVFLYLKDKIPGIDFNEKVGIIYTPLDKDEKELKTGITVICAGTADIPVAEEASITAGLMGNRVTRIYDVGIAGIHRLLSYRESLSNSNVIVAVAGMEGALPSVVSSLVRCIVIGVPTSVGYGASFNGLSQLLTMLNSCSPGIVVVNIDNGFGAGYAAGLINKNFR